jgi:hypothetical protein
MLRSNMMQAIPAFDTNSWVSSGSAYYYLTPTNNTVEAKGRKMLYRFFLCSLSMAEKGNTYTLYWKEGAVPKTETIVSTGDPAGQYSTNHLVDVPLQSGTVINITDLQLLPGTTLPPGQKSP